MKCTERDLSEMLGAYLRSKTPSAKHLARQIGCDPRTAEGFRAGRHWPQAKHWLGLVSAFGRDLTEAVFHPEAAAERLQREVAALERQLAEKEAQLQLVGVDPRKFAADPQKAGTRQAAEARNENRAAEVGGPRDRAA